MLLLAHCISFANPPRKFVVEFRQPVESKSVQMISGRESLDAGKARMLNPARQNKVTDEKVLAHLHGDE